VNERQDSFPPDEKSGAQLAAIPFILRPGEKITSCSGLWSASDRVLDELGRCHACHRPTFRVVTIRSAAELERRAALCGRHFVLAVKRFPELDQDYNSGAA
jgi:hypothetical protein